MRYEDVYGLDSATRTYDAATIYLEYKSADWKPCKPFLNSKDYELGKWFVDSNSTKTAIQDYMEHSLDGDTCQSFQSADDLWTLLEWCDFWLRPDSWTIQDVERGNCTNRIFNNAFSFCHRLFHSTVIWITHLWNCMTRRVKEFITRSTQDTGGGRHRYVLFRTHSRADLYEMQEMSADEPLSL